MSIMDSEQVPTFAFVKLEQKEISLMGMGSRDLDLSASGAPEPFSLFIIFNDYES